MNVLKMQRLRAAAALIAVILGGCATQQPIPELSNPKSSGLAIDVSLKPPLTLFGNQLPDQIYFVKINGEDGLFQQQIIRSNYIKASRAYLLNARPGTYVAVAAFRRVTPTYPATGPEREYFTYFSKELVEQTRVTVQEGDFAFVGVYVVDLSVGLDGADAVQAHYKNVISPGVVDSGLLQFMGTNFHYRGALLERKVDEQAHNEFVRKAKEDLAGSGWSTRIK